MWIFSSTFGTCGCNLHSVSSVCYCGNDMVRLLHTIWAGLVRFIGAEPVFGAHGRCAL
jgi:hypothetical protein